MSTLLVLSAVGSAAVAAVLVYIITRSNYEAQVAAGEAVKAQLTQQVAGAAKEMQDLRVEVATERASRVRAEALLEEERKSITDQKKTLAEAEQKLTTVFEGLASKVLANNATRFLQLANTTLKSGAVKDLQDLVKPIEDTLAEYRDNLKAIEEKRVAAYAGLSTTLAQVGQTQEALRRETSNLVTALRRPGVRGRWGEISLRRIAELAGMSEHCDFHLQTRVETEDGATLRPDMTINLPKGAVIPVDAKVPLDQYLDAMETTTEEDRREHLKNHAAAIRDHVHKLALKNYAAQFQVTPNLTVLFLPNEAFLSAALEHDRALIEDAMQKRIVVSTPVSLYCMLKAVVYGWQQDDIAKNAQAISALGKELYSRIAILSDRLQDLRGSLVSAVDAFDATVGSLESRVLPSARKFKELGATTEEEIEALEKIGREPRAVRVAALAIQAAQK